MSINRAKDVVHRFVGDVGSVADAKLASVALNEKWRREAAGRRQIRVVIQQLLRCVDAGEARMPNVERGMIFQIRACR